MFVSNKHNTLPRTTRKSGRKSCVYINCGLSSADKPDITYIPFPKPCNPFRIYQRKGHLIDSCAHCSKAKRWMLLCGRTVDFYCLDHIDPRTTYVCEKHFINNEPSDEYPDPIQHSSERALTGVWMDEPGPITVLYPNETISNSVSRTRKRPRLSTIENVPIKQENIKEEPNQISKSEEQVLLNNIKVEPICYENPVYDIQLGIEPEITIKEEPINSQFEMGEDKHSIKTECHENNSHFNVKSECSENNSKFDRNNDIIQKDKKEDVITIEESCQYNYNQSVSNKAKTLSKRNIKKRDLEPTDDAPEQVYLQPINKEKYATLPKSIQKMLHELGPLKSTNTCSKFVRGKRQDITDVEDPLNIEPGCLENCDSLPPIPCHLGQFDEMLSLQKGNPDVDNNCKAYEEICSPPLMSYDICYHANASFEFFTGLQLTTFDYIFNIYFKDEETIYKTAKNMFFMALTFLRRGYSNDDIAHLFGLSSENVLRVITYWLNKIYSCFNKWRAFMFGRTAGVLITLLDHNTAFKLAIDTIDVTIKGDPTKLKYLLGIRANCQVAFISKSVAATTTSSKLFVMSDIVKLLTKNDVIVCHDDFNNGIKKKNSTIKVVSPSSSKNIAAKKVLINDALDYAKEVSGLIKAFQVIDNIPSEYKEHADKLVYICGCLVNFQWNRCWANTAEFNK